MSMFPVGEMSTKVSLLTSYKRRRALPHSLVVKHTSFIPYRKCNNNHKNSLGLFFCNVNNLCTISPILKPAVCPSQRLTEPSRLQLQLVATSRVASPIW